MVVGVVVAVAVVAIPLPWHAAEALLEVDMPRADMLAAATLEPGMPEVGMLAMPEAVTPEVLMLGVATRGVATLEPASRQMVLDGTARTSHAPAARIVRGPAPMGVAEIGTVTTTGTTATAIGKIRMANGVGGTGTNGVIPAIMLSSSATLAFPGGGVGAGAPGPVGVGAVTRMGMDITATRIPTMAAVVILTTVTAMDPVTATAMDTAPSTNLSTAVAASPELPNFSGDCHALVITADPLTESLGQKRDAQFRRTSRSTAT